MDIKVLTCDSELKSAKKLGFDTSSYIIGRIEDLKNTLVIRWGNGCSYYNKDGNKSEFINVVQSGDAIRLNCNKNIALWKISKVVKTPKFYVRNVPSKKLVVYRPTLHTGGKDFKVLRGPIKITKGNYATEFLKAEKELRVWFFGKSVICARRVTNDKTKLKEKFQCRSMWGYSFWKKTPVKLHKQVILAAKQIGLLFGAADILVKDGEYYFTEFNTAPTLDNKTIIKFFKQRLNRMVKNKTKKHRCFEKIYKGFKGIVFRPIS
jgi:hypothetical protein